MLGGGAFCAVFKIALLLSRRWMLVSLLLSVLSYPQGYWYLVSHILSCSILPYFFTSALLMGMEYLCFSCFIYVWSQVRLNISPVSNAVFLWVISFCFSPDVLSSQCPVQTSAPAHTTRQFVLTEHARLSWLILYLPAPLHSKCLPRLHPYIIKGAVLIRVIRKTRQGHYLRNS